ncbi:MAG: citrate transporter [Alphaproteobacteria bacterium]
MPNIQAAVALIPAPFEFVLFAATLLGVALFHRRTLQVALAGLAGIVIYKLLFSDFAGVQGGMGLAVHLQHEWVVLVNLALVLTGFAILSRHFEQSRLPDLAPSVLPVGWLGGFALLALVFIFSGILDNIASALIGATVAGHVYKGVVRLGFLAAIVAAANAGGAGSVVGDTTTTMMWVDGKNPLDLLPAYLGAFVCFAAVGIPAALSQHRHHKITERAPRTVTADWMRAGIVAFILVAAVGTNVAANVYLPGVPEAFPVIGTAVWAAIGVCAFVRTTDWKVLGESAKGTLFLISLVLAASLMPVEKLPPPSWETSFVLGFVSAVFDNIPLTALALQQGNYDWGLLAYAVGVGGSMMWFGSSAGVAVSNLYPETKSVVAWLRAAWWMPPAYIAGFFAMLGLLGWSPLP